MIMLFMLIMMIVVVVIMDHGYIDHDHDGKGCHRVRKVQFFLTLFKRPLTPPPPLSFEHHVVNFFCKKSFGILTSYWTPPKIK